MRVALWILLGVVGLYLLTIIPAGIACLVARLRFGRSPRWNNAFDIADCYKQKIRTLDATSRAELVRDGLEERVTRGGVDYVVGIRGKRLDSDAYEFEIGVGRSGFVRVELVERLVLHGES
jgi:hypothetical protein